MTKISFYLKDELLVDEETVKLIVKNTNLRSKKIRHIKKRVKLIIEKSFAQLIGVRYD